MSTKQISQWRTVGLVVFACVVLVLAFLLALAWASPKDAVLDLERAGRLYEYLTDAVVWLVAAVAFKSLGEHLGRGRGLKGVKDTLLTEATPGDAPAPGSQP